MSVISKLGFCKYKIEGDNISNFTVPNDVINGKGINLTLDYTWITTTECTISLSWYPILLNNEGVLEGTTLESNGKYLQKNITLKLNEKTISTSNKMLSTNSINNKVVDGIKGASFPLEFVYSYTPNGSSITYYLEIKTKIFRPNPYDQNVVFTKNGINELLEKIKNYPVVNVGGDVPTTGQPYITIDYGTGETKQVKVGSAISFPNLGNANTSDGTIHITVDGTEYYPKVEGVGNLKVKGVNLTTAENAVAYYTDGIGTLGSRASANGALYATATNGALEWGTLPIAQGGTGVTSIEDLKATLGVSSLPYVKLAGDTMTGSLTINYGTSGTTSLSATGDITAARVFNAVFNDYAECRTTINLAPGHVVIDQDDGSLACSSKRLQPGAQVISDTYGHLMGETEKIKTPIAVAGRVLVYTYQPRENYHAGMAVCSAPNGTVDIMTREEIRDYPDCIIGIVSEIPQYEVWGSNNVKVDGRIWIKVK